MGRPSSSTPRLILASASPRRREILTALGVSFEAIVPEVEEVRVGDPAQMVLHNARRKARAALGGAGGGRPILGVDTDVVLDGRALGKADGRVGAWATFRERASPRRFR